MILTPFHGFVRHAGYSASRLGTVEGVYGWVEPRPSDTPDFRLVHGSFDVVPVSRSIGHVGDELRPFDPFAFFDVRELHRRTMELEIPGVGLSPVQLHSALFNSAIGRSQVKLCRRTVHFRAYARPVPILTRAEAAEILRVAIHDALLEGGHDELANTARAIAVAMAGWPDRPAKKEELAFNFLGRREGGDRS